MKQYGIIKKKKRIFRFPGGTMLDKILHYPNRDIVSRRLANIPLRFCFEGIEINVFWMNYGSDLNKRNAVQGEETVPGDMDMPFHRHSFYEMHLMLDGESVYQTINQNEYVLHKGDAIIIRAGSDHRCSFRSNVLNKVSLSFGLSVHSNSAFAKELNARLMNGDVIRTCSAESFLPILYQILEEVSRQELGYEEATKALTFRLVLALARLNTQDLPDTETLSNETHVDRRIGEIEVFINDHMSEMITPSDVAASIHISTKQINRILQNAFRMNTTEYIAHIKCEHAKHLLAFTDEPITDIATKIGYSSVFSFTKFFKRVEGMPPALFRRSRYQIDP